MVKRKYKETVNFDDPIEKRKWLFRRLSSHLRRISLSWPPRKDSLRRSRLSSSHYICAWCKKVKSKHEISSDHIRPVGPLYLYTNIDNFISAYLPDCFGWQSLCGNCHQNKTNMERKLKWEQDPKRKSPGKRNEKTKRKKRKRKSASNG